MITGPAIESIFGYAQRFKNCNLQIEGGEKNEVSGTNVPISICGISLINILPNAHLERNGPKF